MKEFASLRDLSSGKNVTLRGHQAQVVSLAFAPSGRELATLSSDTTALLWDWRGALPAATKTKAGSSAEAIERAWEELASLDSNRAFAAIWELGSTQEETLRLIGKRLKPIAAPDLERLSKLTADLNSDEFDVRKHASDELRTLGELAEAQLRRLVKDPPSKEALGRAQELLKTTQGPYTSGEKLRALRAIIVLEQIGTPESIAELKRIAKGAPEARVTQDAELALERLEHQSKHK
jgi:WD40 repeat protein